MDKILIRKARKEDIKGIVESFNEGIKRGFTVYTGTNEIRNQKGIKEREKRFVENKKTRFEFVAIDKATKKVVSSCSFYGGKGRTRHRGELGWGVHPDYARRGIATRLLRATIREVKRKGYKRLEAEAAVENVPSLKLAKKFGFKVEGRRKAGLILDNGRYVDTYIFSKVL